YTDPDALACRIAVRPRYMVAANWLIEEGIIKVSGGLDSAEPGPPEPKLVGSLIIYDVPTLADTRALAKKDIVDRSRGDSHQPRKWDKEKLSIYPLQAATTLPDRTGVTQPQPAEPVSQSE
ncbi:hypothetical protein BJ138DRAFT_1009276, partial [Hygrophoropsis aurantiaca]